MPRRTCPPARKAPPLLQALCKPPAERPLQCAKSGFVHWHPCSDGGLHTGALSAVGFVHWSPRPERGLYTGVGRHCTNPLRNDPPSAQSPAPFSGTVQPPLPYEPSQCAKSPPSPPGAAHRRRRHDVRTPSACPRNVQRSRFANTMVAQESLVTKRCRVRCPLVSPLIHECCGTSSRSTPDHTLLYFLRSPYERRRT